MPQIRSTRYIDVAEIETRLEMSRAAVYAAIRRGDIPSIRVGRAVRVLRERFDEWFDRGGTSKVAA